MDATVSRTVLVSACLLGLKTRYDGECRKNSAVSDFFQNGDWIPVPICPEQLGGLPTPRPAAEFTAGNGAMLINGVGQVTNRHNEDVSNAFLLGAEQAVAVARSCNSSIALLKERSPSCGVHSIYCAGELTNGPGVTTACLQAAGITVFSEEEIIAGHLPTKKG